jgi:hypothetical protein
MPCLGTSGSFAKKKRKKNKSDAKKKNHKLRKILPLTVYRIRALHCIAMFVAEKKKVSEK